jgi:hypothetical protein
MLLYVRGQVAGNFFPPIPPKSISEPAHAFLHERNLVLVFITILPNYSQTLNSIEFEVNYAISTCDLSLRLYISQIAFGRMMIRLLPDRATWHKRVNGKKVSFNG